MFDELDNCFYAGKNCGHQLVDLTKSEKNWLFRKTAAASILISQKGFLCMYILVSFS